MNTEENRETIYKNYVGIASFLTFVHLGHLYRSQYCYCKLTCEEIAKSLHMQFINIFNIQPPDSHVEIFKTSLYSAVYPPKLRFDYCGEAHLWFLNTSLIKEELFVFKMMNNLKDSVKKHPIMIDIENKLCEVYFYGWGLCYYQ